MDGKTKALLLSLFGKDKDGNVSLRVVLEEGVGLENAVGTHSGKTLSAMLSSAIVLDDSGKPALRLAAVPFGMTTSQARAETQKRVKEETVKAEAAKKKAAKAAKKKAEEKGGEQQ